ncbi:hypothetical protein SAMD00019534_020930 [Acytostelium subglobosum LB1]|uniref:hypothetical protein n=1 Tax=Acytostelium subglobosum LB1 TaxID=1410327 RepID=UPI0006448409|nr:hypothetical protein SAMD00019534_020930 [Acytostelium subglobosum LB1]GAM18918.1 hypothetical protein SAMD00019534_020930 [Acytostelium subglobosum LB1]|eukprot:XP_012758138.1 hypothetical protein SAMD00019534_020930 [Acytostelium subglobosum LB1]
MMPVLSVESSSHLSVRDESPPNSSPNDGVHEPTTTTMTSTTITTSSSFVRDQETTTITNILFPNKQQQQQQLQYQTVVTIDFDNDLPPSSSHPVDEDGPAAVPQLHHSIPVSNGHEVLFPPSTMLTTLPSGPNTDEYIVTNHGVTLLFHFRHYNLPMKELSEKFKTIILRVIYGFTKKEVKEFLQKKFEFPSHSNARLDKKLGESTISRFHQLIHECWILATYRRNQNDPILEVFWEVLKAQSVLDGTRFIRWPTLRCGGLKPLEESVPEELYRKYLGLFNNGIHFNCSRLESRRDANTDGHI